MVHLLVCYFFNAPILLVRDNYKLSNHQQTVYTSHMKNLGQIFKNNYCWGVFLGFLGGRGLVFYTTYAIHASFLFVFYLTDA